MTALAASVMHHIVLNSVDQGNLVVLSRNTPSAFFSSLAHLCFRQLEYVCPLSCIMMHTQT